MKKFIALLLAMMLVLVAFASCADDKGGKDGDGDGKDQGPKTEKANVETFAADMEAVAKKLAETENFVISVNGTNTVVMPVVAEPTEESDSQVATSQTVSAVSSIKIVKTGNSYRIYGTNEMPGASEGQKVSIALDVSFAGDKLYVNIPAVEGVVEETKMAVEVSQEDISTLITKVMEKVQASMKDSPVSEELINKALGAVTEIDFSNCETVEDMLKAALTKLLPIYFEAEFGEGWEQTLEQQGGLEASVDSFCTMILGKIPTEVLALLNGDVMALLKSDSEFVVFTKTTDKGNSTYNLTIKKELFDEVIKIAKKAVAIFVKEEVDFEAEVKDITFSVGFDADKRLTSASFGLEESANVMGMEIKSKMENSITVSYTSEAITAPSDAADYTTIDNKTFMETANEAIDNMFSPDENEKDDVHPSTNPSEVEE